MSDDTHFDLRERVAALEQMLAEWPWHYDTLQAEDLRRWPTSGSKSIRRSWVESR
jgi:hypothetical protein